MTSPDVAPSSDDRLMAALAWLGAFILLIPTILIFLIKKDQSAYVKRHSLQCIVLTIALIVFWVVFNVLLGILGMIPVINMVSWLGWLIVAPVLSIAQIVLYLWMTYKAYQGENVNLPVVTEFVDTKLMQ